MRKYGFSFSLSRLIGLAGFKNKLSRDIGIPLTKQGRAMKLYNFFIRLLRGF